MIQVRNIYYMLAYAFDSLTEHGFRQCSEEDFDNATDSLAYILERGLTYQVKKGLGKYYVERNDSLTTLRGKIDINGTILNRLSRKEEIKCDYDEFSLDTRFNQIIKTTVVYAILPSNQVKTERKKSLKKLMVHFNDVSLVHPKSIDWNVRLNRYNNMYRMLLYICRLILDGMLTGTSPGDYQMMSYIEEKYLAKLYEKFILNYYKRHRKELNANASIVNWAIDDESDISLLPEMKTDITLSYGGHKLIIDAKFYSSNLQTSQFGRKGTIHSANIYQIFTYIQNMAARCDDNVSGLLLYAKTENQFQPQTKNKIAGHYIAASTLDLSQDFESISKRLNEIADAFVMSCE